MPLVVHGSRDLAQRGERAAERFLRRRRYAVLARNYTCPGGELDLVALHRGVLVFVEVKTRSDDRFGSAFEAVDKRKQKRIIRAATHFLVAHALEEREVRFDVVAVSPGPWGLRCELIADAFEA